MTEALTPAAQPSASLAHLLERIAASGPWGPWLAELTFLGVVLVLTAIGWALAGGPLMRAVARWVGAPRESLRPIRTGVRLLLSLVATASLVSHFTAFDLFTVIAGTFALIATGFVALWSTLSNILCTVLILVTRPFRVGDDISFPPDALEGRVINLSFFFTTLKTADGRYVNVPNTTFFQRIMVRRATDAGRDLGEQLAQPDLDDVEEPPTGSA